MKNSLSSSITFKNFLLKTKEKQKQKKPKKEHTNSLISRKQKPWLEVDTKRNKTKQLTVDLYYCNFCFLKCLLKISTKEELVDQVHTVTIICKIGKRKFYFFHH